MNWHWQALSKVDLEAIDHVLAKWTRLYAQDLRDQVLAAAGALCETAERFGLALKNNLACLRVSGLAYSA